MLFDHNGRPVETGLLRDEIAAPSLTGVRQALSAHPAQGLTPVKLTRVLREAEQGAPDAYLELAEEMEEKDLHYRAVISTRKLAVSGLEITVTAATDGPEDLRAADLAREAVSHAALEEAAYDMLDAVAKGYSATEIVWDMQSGQWFPDKLIWRDPRFFEFDAVGGDLLLKGDSGPRPLEAYKFIVHRSKTKSGLAVRGGLARAAAWLYLFKNYDLKAWNQFLEVFGLPLRLGKYGAGATEAEKHTLLQAVRDIASDAAAIIPETMMVEFISGQASGEGTNSFLVFAQYVDAQISKLVLGQTGTTDTGQYVGTSDAHREVRADIEASDARQLAATLTRDFVRPLVDLNLGPRKLYPQIKIYRPEREDVGAWVQNVIQLVPYGLQVEESVARDKLGLADPPPEARLLTAPQMPPMPAGEFAMNRAERGDVTAAGRAEQFTTAQSQEAAADWVKLLLPSLAKIEGLAAKAENLEDLKEDLLNLMEKGGLTLDDLAEDLAVRMFEARLAGEMGAPKK